MRDTTQLHPRLQLKITQFLTECNKQGYRVRIGECLRTATEQDELYAKGRTKPGYIVTNAKGSSYSSMHQWGVAFDIIRNDGNEPYFDADGWFTKVGRIGQSIGLEWGGAWKSITDKPHFQLPDWGSTTTKLRQTYGTPDNFKKTWDNSILKEGQQSLDDLKKLANALSKPKEFGTETEKTKFKVLKTMYLRTEPTNDKHKVKFTSLKDSIKNKCTIDSSGDAKIEKGSIITRVRRFKESEGNIWYQMSAGYWIYFKQNGEKRLEEVK